MLRVWRDWTRTAPEDVTTSMRVMHFPPLPELPDFLRGRSVAVIDGAFAGEAGPGAEAIAALRALEPELDTWAMVPAVALSRIHMDPEEPMPSLSEGAFFGELDEAALEAFEAHIQPGAPLMFAELRHLGGALARVPEGAGATGAFDGEYLYFTGRHRHGAGDGGGRPCGGEGRARRARALRDGVGEPELRRRADRPGHVLHARRRTRACARSAPPSTRTD